MEQQRIRATVSYKLRTEPSLGLFAQLKLENVSVEVFPEYEVLKRNESEVKSIKEKLKKHFRALAYNKFKKVNSNGSIFI